MPNDIPPYSVETEFPCANVPLSGGAAPGFNLSFSCVPENLRSSTRIKVEGGSPPYIVTTSQGQVAIIDTNIFEIKIDRSVFITSFTGYNGVFCTHLQDLPGGPNIGNPGYDPYLHSFLGGNSYAFIRLGMERLTKGIFEECRHHCTFVGYDCLDRYLGLPPSIPPTTSGTIVGNNTFVIDPNECPFSEDITGVPHSPGRGLGPCYNAHSYDLASESAYPSIWYHDEFGEDPPRDFAECAQGAIDPANGEEIAAAYLANAGPKLDVRHPNLIAAGCSPCSLVQGTNITVTVIDSSGVTIIITVPVL